MRDNNFKIVPLNLFFVVWTNLINNNVFYNHIFIYYKNNHKCNIYINIYIYVCVCVCVYRHTYIKFLLYLNENNTIFLKNLKDSKNIDFLIKIIYNILCIIKKYIKFENYFF